MKYLATYIIYKLAKGSEDDRLIKEGHTIILEAETKIIAFVNVYHILTAKGYLVCTLNPLYNYNRDDWTQEIIYNYSYAGLSTEEMESIFKMGIPKNNESESTIIITNIDEYKIKLPVNDTTNIDDTIGNKGFIDNIRIDQLKTITNKQYDLQKLIRICEEINICYANEPVA